MPPPGNPNLMALWLTDSHAASRLVIEVLESTRTLAEAAKKLGVGKRTLCRWLKEKPELQEGGE